MKIKNFKTKMVWHGSGKLFHIFQIFLLCELKDDSQIFISATASNLVRDCLVQTNEENLALYSWKYS